MTSLGPQEFHDSPRRVGKKYIHLLCGMVYLRTTAPRIVCERNQEPFLDDRSEFCAVSRAVHRAFKGDKVGQIHMVVRIHVCAKAFFNDQCIGTRKAILEHGKVAQLQALVIVAISG